MARAALREKRKKSPTSSLAAAKPLVSLVIYGYPTLVFRYKVLAWGFWCLDFAG